MVESIRHQELRRKFKAIREGFPESVSIRVHRAISWFGRSEECGDDADAQFLFLWIAFNAAYADADRIHNRSKSELFIQTEFFEKLASLDKSKKINAAVWQHFSGPIRSLMDNEYVYHEFWEYHNGLKEGGSWREGMESSKAAFNKAFKDHNSATVLTHVFNRLYVLRNQLMHGGSTWNSDVNRRQVRDGAAILSFLIPVFIDILMDNPNEHWGETFYPIVKAGAD